MNKKMQAAKDFVEKVKADRAAKELYQDPAFKLDDVIHNNTYLKKEVDLIFNAPPPKPKEEKKEDEKMADESKEAPKDEKKEDAEMAPEGDEKPKE